MTSETKKYIHKRDGSVAYLFSETKGYDCPGYGAKAYWARTPDATEQHIWVAHEFHRRFEAAE